MRSSKVFVDYGDATLQDQDTAGAYGSTKMNADSPSKRVYWSFLLI